MPAFLRRNGRTPANPPRAIDRFNVWLDSSKEIAASNFLQRANLESPVASASIAGKTAAWARLVLRYATGSGNSLFMHVAAVDIMAAANSTDCDFDASAIIGSGVKWP